MVSSTTSFDGDVFSWFGRLSSTFTLPKDFNVQLTGMYRGGSKTAQSERKPIYGVDLSISKDLFDDNATLTASVRDLFNTRAFRRSEEHTSELQSRGHLVCRLLLQKNNKK